MRGMYGFTQETQEAAREPQCPMTWDGWQCWQPAEPGTEVRGECPYYTYSMPNIMSTPDPKDYFSVKECTNKAKWWKINNSTVEWTDYRKCATSKLYERQKLEYELAHVSSPKPYTLSTIQMMQEESLKHFLGVSAFAISVLAIIPALIIFNVYRSLRVDRIRIHKHLLLSLLLTGMFYIFNNIFFIVDDAPGSSMLESNHALCRLAFLIQLRYFRTSNYMWMLCEGFYLYKLLLIDAFSSENSSLIIYYLSGWAAGTNLPRMAEMACWTMGIFKYHHCSIFTFPII
uniref:Calcitonin receptor n=1 Tax=Romanomermis culicivorax TaxID=13658 RepID=A0A915L206_ROMCU